MEQREVVEKRNQALASTEELLKQVIANPMLSGLLALGLNQAAYRAGLYLPRKLSDGRFAVGKWTSPGFDFSSGFPQIKSPEIRVVAGTELEAETVAASNATLISGVIMTGMLLYAQKAPLIQPIIGVKT